MNINQFPDNNLIRNRSVLIGYSICSSDLKFSLIFPLLQVIYFLNLIKNQHKCKICIDLGIPLKDLKNYVNADGELESEHLLKDGKKLAKEKIRKIESYIDSINRTLQHINALKTFQEPREIHSDPLVVFPQKLLSHGNTNVIISSMSPNTYKYDKVTLEFQIQT